MILSCLLLLPGAVRAGVDCGGSQLNFPRLSFEPGTLTGIAIVNPNLIAAPIRITAYGSGGELLQGENFLNPVDTSIGANQQFARTTEQIFQGSLAPETLGWFQVCSPVHDLTGFFLFLDVPTTLLDGADLPPAAQKIFFNDVRVAPGLDTELNVINPGAIDTTILLQIFPGESAPPASGSFEIRAKGALRIDVGAHFEISNLEDGATAVVTSQLGAPVAGFELVGPAPVAMAPAGGMEPIRPATPVVLPDALGLTARPASEILETLYFPQLAVGGGIGTEISVTNYTVLPEIVTLSAHQPDGSLFGAETVNRNLVTQNLPPGATIRLDARELFGFPEEGVFQGWVKVRATRASINGSVSYSVPSAGSLASVASATDPRTVAIFSHLATSLGFFTGVAGLNTGAFPATLKVTALRPDGQILGAHRRILLPGERFSEIISTIIPEAAGQAGGMIWVKSDLPIYLTSLFGFSGGGLPNVLANIPPQPAPPSFQPDGAERFLDVFPIQGIVAPSESLGFTTPAGGPVWRLNNQITPDPALGNISQTGLYTAPSQVPRSQPVAVTVQTASNQGAATVDIVDPEVAFSGFGVLQSLVHLEGLQALFTAELLAALGPAEGSRPAGPQSTRILEVRSQDDRREVAAFPGAVISKMLPFRAATGTEYLILANQTAGEILGINPLAPTPVVVRSGFDQPATMAYDTDANLVVADQSGFHVIFRAELETDLGGAAQAPGSSVQPPSVSLGLFDMQVDRPGSPSGLGGGSPGIAVDECSGDFYFSDPQANRVVRLEGRTGLSTSFEDILQPGRLLPLYRREVGCPFSFSLLIAETGRNRVLLLNPHRDIRFTFVGSEEPRDLILIEGLSRFADLGAVLIADSGNGLAGSVLGDNGTGIIVKVEVPNLWEERPGDDTPDCPGGFRLNDPNLHAAVAGAFGLEPEDPVPCDLAGAVTEILADGAAVRDLGGLDRLSNLGDLRLNGNRVEDLSPIERSTGLSNLELAENQFTDVSPLRQLTALRSLDLSGNPIGDPGPIGSLLQLRSLDLDRTGLADLALVRDLAELEDLRLNFNSLTSLAPLDALAQLTNLEIQGNAVDSLSLLLGNPGLGAGDRIDARRTGLGPDDCPDIAALEERGVTVLVDGPIRGFCGMPTITGIEDQVIDEDTSTGPLGFVIGDSLTPPESLSVTARSSNSDVIHVSGLRLSGVGADRTIEVRPIRNANGGPVTVTLTVSDGFHDVETSFLVTVNPVNDPPTITPPGDQVTEEDTATGPLVFTIGDPETAAGALTVTAVSSDQTLVPNSNLTLAGAGANRTIDVLPAADQNGGPVTVTLTVDDGTESTNTQFAVTVAAVNDPPTISSIANQTIVEDNPTGPLPFTVGDIETAPADLVVTASSSDQGRIPDGNLTLGGAGANRTIDVQPAPDQNGGAVTITVTVDDGSDSTDTQFLVTIDPVNDAPTISAIANQTTDEDTATGPLAFTIDDIDTDLLLLSVTAVSSDQTLIPDGNLTLGGAGANRTIDVLPAPDQNGGPATITVTVDDGTDSTDTQFTVTVDPVNDAPTITAIASQTIDEDTPTGPLAFTVDDVETEPGALTVTAVSSDQTLIPDGNLTLGGAGASRTIDVLPAPDQNGGPATITVTVDDGTDSTDTQFTVMVTPVNDAPTITPIANQVVLEDNSTGMLAFTVDDVETAAALLTVSGESSNQTLIPDSNLVFGGAGANRTIDVLPAADQNGGPATITVTVDDGTDTGSTQFDVTVTAVNDTPSFTKGPNQTVGTGAETVAGWATDITAGAANEEPPVQALTFVVTGNTNPSIFAVLPAVSSSSGDLTFETSAPGTATITLVLMDDGGGDNTSAPQMFTIDVIAAPMAVDDFPGDDPAYFTAPGVTLETSIADLLPVTDNDTLNGATIDAGVKESTMCTPDPGCSNNVTLMPNGHFRYIPPAEFAGVDSFTYTLTNASGMSTATVTIEVVAIG